MISEPTRYQLNKEGMLVLRQGHPWIFRSHISSAADIFESGRWLNLVDSSNKTLGYGIYEKEGLIGIRIFKKGPTPPDTAWFGSLLDKALARRKQLRNFATGYRVLHGENDGLPGIVIDLYGDVAVLQTYAESLDATGRLVLDLLKEKLPISTAIWKLPTKRKNTQEQEAVQLLWGKDPGSVAFREGKLELHVTPFEGQKSGTFLDLRGLRKWVSTQKLNGKRVLNLFSYSGTLGLAAEVAGAKEIWNVDISPGALDFAKEFHAKDKKKHKYIAADIFEWLSTLPAKERFDLVIVDPPQMASLASQVPAALAAFRKLAQRAATHVAPQGKLVVASCTARFVREDFTQSIKQALGKEFRMTGDLKPEDDHPVGFPEGDYLKILLFDRKTRTD